MPARQCLTTPSIEFSEASYTARTRMSPGIAKAACNFGLGVFKTLTVW